MPSPLLKQQAVPLTLLLLLLAAAVITATAHQRLKRDRRAFSIEYYQRLMHRIDRLTDDMADQVKNFRGRRRQLARSVEDLLGRYRNGEMDNSPGDDLGREVIQTTQSVFVQKIQTLSETASFNLTYTA